MAHTAPRIRVTPARRFAESVVERAGILDDRIAEGLIEAFSAVRREHFFDARLRTRAPYDCPLSCGFGRITPRPSVLARLYGLAGVGKGTRIMEVGCGSGYGSAVLSACGAEVYAIEPTRLLAQHARRCLDSAGFQRVLVRPADEWKGWRDHAPYDAIVFSMPIARMNDELLTQLIRPGGRLIAPIGSPEQQALTLWEVRSEGFAHYQLEPCSIYA